MSGQNPVRSAAALHIGRDPVIDLLIVQDGTLYPLEFRKSASPGRDAIRPFGALRRLDRTVGPGGVICLVGSSRPLDEGLLAIPVGAI
ncbi:MAG: hypothetical protein MUE73_05880 [Planctomycetes bacterium]|jgi:hypothetical protein|nr:hypothetical protein [Planctomycetota bacterium]